MRRAYGGGLVLVVGLAVPLLTGAAQPSVEGPAPGHTGGFGEPTCAACHSGPAPADVVLTLEGLPSAWEPHREYAFDVVLRAPELGRGGFQLAARFADGTQAGSLRVHAGGRVTMSDAGTQYAHHGYEGTFPAEPGIARWTLTWTSPPISAGEVTLHAAGNAANDDNSEFGDRVVASSATVAGPR